MLELGKLIVTCSLAKKITQRKAAVPSSNLYWLHWGTRLDSQRCPFIKNKKGRFTGIQRKTWDKHRINIFPVGLFETGSKFHSPHHHFTKEFLHRSSLSDSIYNWHPLTLLEVLCLALFKCTTRPNQRMHQHQGNCSTQPGSIIQGINLGSSSTACTKRQNTRKKKKKRYPQGLKWL